MAKAVTLKNNNNEEIYPVTDISLVNGELNGARIVNASVGSDKLTPNAVWEENIKDGAVTSSKIDWTTSIRTILMSSTTSTTPTSAWTEFNLGSSATVTGLIPGKTYLVRTSSDWTEGKGEFRTNIKAGTTSLSMCPYNSNGPLTAVSYEDVITIPSGVTTATIQRAYSGEKIGVRVGTTRVTFQIIN